MTKNQEMSVEKLLLQHINNSEAWREQVNLALKNNSEAMFGFNQMAMEELADLKTKVSEVKLITESHQDTVDKIINLEVKFLSLIWFSEILKKTGILAAITWFIVWLYNKK